MARLSAKSLKYLSFSSDEREFSNLEAQKQLQKKVDRERRRLRRFRARLQDLQLGVIVRYLSRTGCSGP
jgi:hypothetical protein